MKRSPLRLTMATIGLALLLMVPAWAEEEGRAAEWREDKILLGAELGGTGALTPLDRFVDNGAVFSPWGSYMFNDLIGVMGQLHLVAIPNRDRKECLTADPEVCRFPGEVVTNPPNGDDPTRFRGVVDSDVTWATGATVGPRIALPLGDIEIWGTWQGGIFTGLESNSAITDTSWGFTTGGGASLALTDTLSFGFFARYNRLYQRVHGRGDVRYASGGINLTYRFEMPEWSAPEPPPK